MKTFHNQVRELRKLGYSEQELSLLMRMPIMSMSLSASMSLRKIIGIMGSDDYKTKWVGDTPDFPKMTEHYHKILIEKAIHLFERMSKMGATEEELKRAAEYVLVCIDCIKCELDYKACYIGNGIDELEEKYSTKKED